MPFETKVSEDTPPLFGEAAKQELSDSLKESPRYLRLFPKGLSGEVNIYPRDDEKYLSLKNEAGRSIAEISMIRREGGRDEYRVMGFIKHHEEPHNVDTIWVASFPLFEMAVDYLKVAVTHEWDGVLRRLMEKRNNHLRDEQERDRQRRETRPVSSLDLSDSMRRAQSSALASIQSRRGTLDTNTIVVTPLGRSLRIDPNGTLHIRENSTAEAPGGPAWNTAQAAQSDDEVSLVEWQQQENE